MCRGHRFETAGSLRTNARRHVNGSTTTWCSCMTRMELHVLGGTSTACPPRDGNVQYRHCHKVNGWAGPRDTRVPQEPHGDGRSVWPIFSLHGAKEHAEMAAALLGLASERLSRHARRRWREHRGVSEAGFRTLVQHASDVITILDSQGIARYESPALEPVLGYSPTS